MNMYKKYMTYVLAGALFLGTVSPVRAIDWNAWRGEAATSQIGQVVGQVASKVQQINKVDAAVVAAGMLIGGYLIKKGYNKTKQWCLDNKEAISQAIGLTFLTAVSAAGITGLGYLAFLEAQAPKSFVFKPDFFRTSLNLKI